MTKFEEIIPKKDAVVFFARDFLSIEFPKLGEYFSQYKRIYLTVREAESENVRKSDSDCEIFNLNEWQAKESEYIGKIDDNLFNRDRYLRNYSGDEILAVSRSLYALCARITSDFNVLFYFDEPVSGYPNGVFSSEFRRVGATCLHFQTSWLPGFMFFVEDFAQKKPVKLEILAQAKLKEVVAEHVMQRKRGLARPLYVSNYSAKYRRLLDIGTLSLKVAFRSFFRRDEYYLDRDASSHRIHIACLLRSLVAKYTKGSDLQPNKDKFVLFPLHYEPESILSYFSPFLRQEEVAARLLDTLPLGYRLILKEHPSQPGALFLPKWKDLRRSDRVDILAGSADVGPVLTALDVVVVTIGSTLGLEAALAGRPVGLLGDVHYSTMPGIKRLSQPEDWVKLINAKVAGESEIIEWYANFLEVYCMKGNFMKGKTNVSNFEQFISVLFKIKEKGLSR